MVGFPLFFWLAVPYRGSGDTVVYSYIFSRKLAIEQDKPHLCHPIHPMDIRRGSKLAVIGEQG